MASETLLHVNSYLREPECTTKCHSPVHASIVMNVITRGGEEEVMAYLQWLCSNHYHLTDSYGRTALHLAASCGKWQVLRWLLSKRLADCNPRDWESGWTPLHRSLYYGQLIAATILINNGANLFTLDHDRLSPLDLVMKDRPKYVDYLSSGLYEAYVWGLNYNYNLGLGIPQSKSSPELLDAFRKDNISIAQIVMRKFHTMFRSQGGQVFTCGHGHGGRLGLPVERTVLTPQLLKSVSKEICIQIACGTDHNVLLMESGSVWTCGNNAHHQLGHVPPMEKLLTPRPITGSKLFKSYTVLGVSAARYHSVVYTKEVIFTFGLNAGQLGHASIGDKLQTAPKIVSALTNQEIKFTHVTSSDGATICITEKGDIYALHEYQCRKIASKRFDVIQVLASGGCLDTKVDTNALKEGGGTELRVVFLTKIGEIFVWSERYPQVTCCLLSIGRQLHVVDFALFNEGLLLVTNDGEAFIGNFIPPKVQARKSEDHAGRQSAYSVPKQMVTSFITFLERDECFNLKVKRLANVHRATAVACDHKGRNFAVLQAHPKSSLLEVPQLSPTQIVLNMLTLLRESDPCDNFHDVIIKFGQCQFAGHKYLLAHNCEFFHTEILKESSTFGKDDCCIDLTDLNVQPSIMQDIFEFLYTNTCKLLTNGHTFQLSNSPATGTIKRNDSSRCVAQPPDLIVSTITNKKDKSGKTEKATAKKSNYNPVKLMEAAAKKLGISALEKKLANVQFVDGRINIAPKKTSASKLKFDRMKLPELYDVNIKCEDGKEIKCHKCVLVARSDYFFSMLASDWIETQKSSSLTIPILSSVMETVIDCLYTDDAPKLMISDDIEFVCNTLAIADRLLNSRLKELCEIRLTDLLTLKNATELLQLSWIYNAPQLKATCMQFVGLNLPALLEAKSLTILSDEVLVELTKNYRELISQMCYRAITPYSNGPCLEDLQAVAQMFPIKVGEAENDKEASQSFKAQEVKKSKTKRKSHVRKINSVSEQELGRRSRNESTSSIGSDVMHKNDLVVLNNEIVIKPITAPEELTEQDQCESLPLSPSTPSSSSSPPPAHVYSPTATSTWLDGKEDMNSEFPDLLSELKPRRSLVDSEPNKTSSDSFRRTPKLSQKQRKKLASKSVPEPVTIRSEKQIKYGNPWLKGTLDDSAALPLKDIMAMEKGSACSKNNGNNVPSAMSSSTSSSAAKQHVINSLELPKQLGNAWQSGQAVVSTSYSSIEKCEPNKSGSNPSSKDVAPCFSDILRSEQEEFHNLSKIGTKPLHLIQLEDQAIEELLNLYKARDNPDELITVERISPQNVATPIWKPNKSLEM